MKNGIHLYTQTTLIFPKLMTESLASQGALRGRSRPAAICLSVLSFLAALFVSDSLVADMFYLKDAGRIEGEYLNPTEVPRKTHRVKLEDGFELAIEARQLDRRRPGQREALAEYNTFAPLLEDTIENHLEIARWCREHQLPDLNTRHLYRILEHDPDHKDARHLLNHYRGPDGNWTTRDEQLGRKGLILSGGSWKTQQQIDVEQILKRRKETESTWKNRIDALRGSLPVNQKAINELLSISDPAATRALTEALAAEPNEGTRNLLIRALSNIGTSAALQEIARWSLVPRENTDVRRTCLEELDKHREAMPLLIGFYASHLRPEHSQQTINAAAFALGELNARTAIPQLIDALVVQRKEKKVVRAQGPSFGNSGVGGLSWGQQEVERSWEDRNQAVLSALIRMTGMNFLYDQEAWKAWLLESRQTKSFNLRRG